MSILTNTTVAMTGARCGVTIRGLSASVAGQRTA